MTSSFDAALSLSAAVAHLRARDRVAFNRLLEIVQQLPEYEVRALDIGKGGYGDVMIALKERRGRRTVVVPARQMSDGMLRMLAIATALLTGGGGLAIEAEAQDRPGTLMLVIEELENGLHPSQAAALLQLVSAASAEQGFQVMVTTHSPALLNALSGDQHRGVVVIRRERTSGQSTVSRLVDLPGYARLMVTGRLGDAVAQGRLADAAVPGHVRPPPIRGLPPRTDEPRPLLTADQTADVHRGRRADQGTHVGQGACRRRQPAPGRADWVGAVDLEPGARTEVTP